MIPLSRPSLTAADHAAVVDVLASGMLVQGARVAQFEAAVAARVGRGHAVAVANGTAALALGLEALGVGPGDEVLVPGLTWPSPAHAVRLVGATPVLVDVCPDTWNVTAAAITAARTPRTRAAIAIDQFGNPLEMDAIEAAAEGLHLVEDAACAIGSRYGARACGSLGVLSCLSFHPRKVLTTGEGGMVLTDDAELAEQLRRLRNHGQSPPGTFHRAAGNHRMTELAAALGLGQLARLDAIVDARNTHAAFYREALAGLPLQRTPATGVGNAQTFGVLARDRGQRDAAVAALRAEGIEAGILSYALRRLPSVGRPDDVTDVAESIVDRGLCLPLYPELTRDDAEQVVRAIRRHLP